MLTFQMCSSHLPTAVNLCTLSMRESPRRDDERSGSVGTGRAYGCPSAIEESQTLQDVRQIDVTFETGTEVTTFQA